jgi:hypothetical protein
MQRSRRRIVEATAVATLVSAAPSTAWSFASSGDLRAVISDGLRATRAAGVLIPPGGTSLRRGVIAHVVVSVLVGQLLARIVPDRHPVIWGAVAGLVIGIFNLGVIGRRYPALRELPLGPQLADNMAFGALFGAVVDRP